MNTRDTVALDKIFRRYNANNDCGPEAPVQWSTYELAAIIERLINLVGELSYRIAYLEEAANHK